MNKIIRTIDKRKNILNNLYTILNNSNIKIRREVFNQTFSLDIDNDINEDVLEENYEALNYYLSLYNNLLGESSMLGVNEYLNLILANEISSFTLRSEINCIEDKVTNLLNSMNISSPLLNLLNLESLIEGIIKGDLVKLLKEGPELKPVLILLVMLILRTVINENINSDEEDEVSELEEVKEGKLTEDLSIEDKSNKEAIYRLNTKGKTLHNLQCKIGQKSKESSLIYSEEELEGLNIKRCGICLK